MPVQYDVLNGYGPVLFSSYRATGTYSYLEFDFTNPVAIEKLATLSAVYQFQTGNCQAGALRWSIYLQDGSVVHAYYEADPNTNPDCITGADNLSGVNLLDATRQAQPRYELQGSGSPLYVPWATILAEKAGAMVTGVNFILDSGFAGDEVLTPGYPLNPTVGTSDGSTATFIPKAGGYTAVCPTAPATIQVSKIGASGSLTIDESLVSTVPDQGTSFRINGCKYQYNISGKSLGVGMYQVDAIIGGVPAAQTGSGTKFALK